MKRFKYDQLTRAVSEQKTHFKLYKVGKQWVISGLSTIAVFIGGYTLLGSSKLAHLTNQITVEAATDNQTSDAVSKSENSQNNSDANSQAVTKLEIPTSQSNATKTSAGSNSDVNNDSAVASHGTVSQTSQQSGTPKNIQADSAVSMTVQAKKVTQSMTTTNSQSSDEKPTSVTSNVPNTTAKQLVSPTSQQTQAVSPKSQSLTSTVTSQATKQHSVMRTGKTEKIKNKSLDTKSQIDSASDLTSLDQSHAETKTLSRSQPLNFLATISEGESFALDQVKRYLGMSSITQNPLELQSSEIYVMSDRTFYAVFAPYLTRMQQAYAKNETDQVLYYADIISRLTVARHKWGDSVDGPASDQDLEGNFMSVAVIVNVDQNGRLIQANTVRGIKAGYYLSSNGWATDPKSGNEVRLAANPIDVSVVYGQSYGNHIHDADKIPNTPANIDGYTFVNTTYDPTHGIGTGQGANPGDGYFQDIASSEKYNVPQIVINHYNYNTAAPTQVALQAKVVGVSKTYDGTKNFATLPTVTLSGKAGATVTGLTANDFNWGSLSGDVGQTSVTLNESGINKVLAQNANTTLAANAITAGTDMIEKAHITITADNANKIAGEADPTLTATVKDKPAAGVAPSYQVNRQPGDTPGTYTITVSDQNPNPNYAITYQTGTFTINPKPTTALKVVVGTATKTYDGTATFTTTPSVEVNGTKVNDLAVNDFDWSKVNTNVGQYMVTLNTAGINQLLADNPNTTLDSKDVQSGQVSISQARIIIKADDANKVVGENDPTLTATVSDKPASGADPSYQVTREPGNNVGTYKISVSDKTANPNYDITYQTGTFTITAKPTTALKAIVGTADKTYDGTTIFTKGPSVEVNGAQATGLTVADFDWSAVNSSNVGQYGVTLNAAGIKKILTANPDATLASADVKAGLATISKAGVTVKAENAEKVSGQPDPKFTATPSGVPEQGVPVIYSVKRDGTTETPGTYPIVVTVNESDNPNYTVTPENGTLTIKPVATTALTAKVGDVSKSYDGTMTFDQLPGVTLTGKTGARVTGLTADDFDWGTLTSNAGTASVTLNAKGIAAVESQNANTSLAVTAIQAGTATINPLDVTITAANASKIEGQKDPTFTSSLSAIPAHVAAPQFQLVRQAGEAVGQYPINIVYDASQTTNYKIIKVAGTFTISPVPTKEMKATIANVTKAYDGHEISEVPTVTLTGGTQDTATGLTLADFNWGNLTTNVGQTAVTLNDAGIQQLIKDNPNTTLVTNDITAGTAAITPKEVTITAKDAQKVYGTKDPQLTETVAGKPTDGVALNYQVERAIGENAGTYPISIKPGDNPNYQVKSIGGTFTITKAKLTAAVGTLTKTYDGTTAFKSLPTVSLDGPADAKTPTLDATDFDFSGVKANAGTYQVKLSEAGLQKIAAANPNAIITMADVTAGQVKITPAPITIEANPATRVFGQAEPTLTGTVTGKPAQGIAPVYTVDRKPGNNVGTYPITVEYDANKNPNYQILVKSNQLTITPASLKAEIAGVQKDYDSTKTFNDVPTVTLSGLKGSVVPTLTTADFDWTGVTSANVGTYHVALTQKAIDKINQANPNELLTIQNVQTGTAMIKQQALQTAPENTATKPADDKDASANQPLANSVVVTGATKTYDGTAKIDPTLFKVVGPTAATDFKVPELTASDFDLSGVTSQNVGKYQVQLSQSGLQKLQNANPNYFLTVASVQNGLLVITPAAVTITPNDLSKTAETKDPKLTAKVTGQPTTGTAVQYEVSRQSGEAVGTYTIQVTADAQANPDYQVHMNTGVLTIMPISATATVADSDKVYDGTNDLQKLPKVQLIGLTQPVYPTLTAADFDWSAMKPNVGQYAVTLSKAGIAKLLAANPQISLTAQNVKAGKVTVAPTIVVIHADNQQKTAGQDDPTLTATVMGLPANGVPVRYTVTRASGEQPGKYQLTVKTSIADNPNYTVRSEPGELVITKAQVTSESSQQSGATSEASQGSSVTSQASTAASQGHQNSQTSQVSETASQNSQASQKSSETSQASQMTSQASQTNSQSGSISSQNGNSTAATSETPQQSGSAESSVVKSMSGSNTHKSEAASAGSHSTSIAKQAHSLAGITSTQRSQTGGQTVAQLKSQAGNSAQAAQLSGQPGNSQTEQETISNVSQPEHQPSRTLAAALAAQQPAAKGASNLPTNAGAVKFPQTNESHSAATWLSLLGIGWLLTALGLGGRKKRQN